MTTEESKSKNVTSNLHGEVTKETEVKQVESQSQSTFQAEHKKLQSYQPDFQKLKARFDNSAPKASPRRQTRSVKPMNDFFSNWQGERKSLEEFFKSFALLESKGSELFIELKKASKEDLSASDQKITEDLLNQVTTSLRRLGWNLSNIELHSKAVKSRKSSNLWGWRSHKDSPFQVFFSEFEWTNKMRAIDLAQERLQKFIFPQALACRLKWRSCNLNKKTELDNSIKTKKLEIALDIAKWILGKMDQLPKS